MEKDIGLAIKAGANVKARLPLGLHALSLYQHLMDHGYSNKGIIIIIIITIIIIIISKTFLLFSIS